MSRRLEALQKLARSPGADSFTWYALALEHNSLGQTEEAVKTFEMLRQRDPDYVPMYLMAATLLHARGRHSEAQDWAQAGLDRARAKGETHACDKLSDLLDGIRSSAE